MGGSTPTDRLSLPLAGLDILLPMVVIVSRTGHVSHVGATLEKLRPGLTGQRFLEVFELRRPRNVRSFADLSAHGGGPMQVTFRTAPNTAFRGVGVVLPGKEGIIVNLSLGIGVVDALAVHDLSSADFAPTDLTMEMLYLVEANAAVQVELRRLNKRLLGAKSVAEELAHTDTLTGLRNRRALDLAMERYRSGTDPFAIMQMDLDFFKEVNDIHGHNAGDLVLRTIGRILLEETREADTVVRTGGDEFVLILHRITDRDRLGVIAARLLKRIREPVFYEGNICRVSASIGISVSHEYRTPDPATMIHDADAALYVSKNAGRGRYSFVDSGGDTPAEQARSA